MTAPILMSTAGWSDLTVLLVLLCAIGGVLFGYGIVMENLSAQARRLVSATTVALWIVAGIAAIAVYWPYDWWSWCFCLSLIGF